MDNEKDLIANEEPKEKKSKKKVILAIVAIILIGAIGAGVWLCFKYNVFGKTEEAAPQEEPWIAPSAEELAQIESDIEAYKAIIMSEPQNIDASIGLIRAFSLKGDIEAARIQADRISQLVPTELRIYDEMVGGYIYNRDYVGAALYIDTIASPERERYEAKLRNSNHPLYAGFGNSPANIVNSGYVCITDDAVYYSERMDGRALYKADLNGKNKVKLSDIPARDINVVGDTVYFVHNDQFVIHSVKTDGSDAKEFLLTMAKGMAVFGDRLYYINWGEDCKIYSVKLDGTDNKLAYDVCAAEFTINGPWIYYSEHNNEDVLARIRIDGEDQAMFEAQKSIFINYADGYTYYVNWNDGGKLYRYYSGGNDYPEPIIDSKVGYVNIYGDWIYYIDWINGESIHRKSLKDGTVERITKDSCEGVYIKDNYIYYYNAGDGKRLYRMNLDGKGKTLIGQ